MKKRVEFDAHRVVKRPTEVEFVTKLGKGVEFVAKKAVKVPVHVAFRARVH